MSDPAAPRLLLVTGLSGAGKSTVLKVLEDLGWEVVDNLPLALLDALIDAPVSYTHLDVYKRQPRPPTTSLRPNRSCGAGSRWTRRGTR